MRSYQETGEHPAFTRFRTIKIVAEKAVDKAYSENPQATEEQKRKLAGDLSWTLLRIRFGVGGDPKTVWHDFKTNIRSFPNNTTEL